MKVKGLNELAQVIEYEETVRTHEKKSRKALVTQRVNELVASGVDKELAKVMASVEYDYNI